MDGPTGDGPDPAFLVDRAEANEVTAWDTLVQRYNQAVWNVARGMGLSRNDAADVQQTVWLRLVEHLAHLRDPACVGSWLLTTARNESRRLRAVDARTRPGHRPGPDPQNHQDPERHVVARDQMQMVLRALDTLPDPCPLLLRLSVVTPDLTATELAAATAIPEHRIAAHRRRCLQRLRTRLDASPANPSTDVVHTHPGSAPNPPADPAN
ncbi:sigma-70 family RNA polymerase sigma factor [Lipingzhangella sp. LS1_29]|uniref:Sigma-70 family RNA polymerase sigma factor n=1 Tax=Lipingzhangella rawalii TaxID=2055835 RepID=A0ABU2H6C0_9ACTN|nr:sigma-70 family RNA polymerase sigma factor [Lipingzhangella rawalii]MDS1270852.1 sigma-70 family RNA polymerase sigma factor [Lipingzhangella rawalii]